jgi:hypothetical protein
LAFLTQIKAKLCKNLIITLVLEKTPIFSPKIDDNCDYNIDSWSTQQPPDQKVNSAEKILTTSDFKNIFAKKFSEIIGVF